MKRFDFTVFIGLLIGLVAIGAAAWLEGIRLGFLWQPNALLVVFGGTTGAVVIRRGVRGTLHALRAVFKICRREDTGEIELLIARLSWLARAEKREGVRVFETHARTNPDPLVARALQLAADYAEPAIVRAQLERLLDEEDEHGRLDADVLEAAGGYTPTFGILGAVLGLITVLRQLADPTALGAGIATAFVATLYGVGAANLLILPLAARLREHHDANMRRREKLLDALVALAARETLSQIVEHISFNESNTARKIPLRERRTVTG